MQRRNQRLLRLHHRLGAADRTFQHLGPSWRWLAGGRSRFINRPLKSLAASKRRRRRRRCLRVGPPWTSNAAQVTMRSLSIPTFLFISTVSPKTKRFESPIKKNESNTKPRIESFLRLFFCNKHFRFDGIGKQRRNGATPSKARAYFHSINADTRPSAYLMSLEILVDFPITPPPPPPPIAWRNGGASLRLFLPDTATSFYDRV